MTDTKQPDFSEDNARWQAVLDRDRRADGGFWCGVVTTGIYCRPQCAARPKRENVRFFTSREAARAAGLRACKRCRPDDDGYAGSGAVACDPVVSADGACHPPIRLSAKNKALRSA